MEKVTYLIGAGFSAPLGLPVMSNFLVKSKDLYFQDPLYFQHFKEVFSAIQDMSICKNYYDTDLFNIEEILSILEMGNYVQGKKLKKIFLQYIIDVISSYTPPISFNKFTMSNWTDFTFGGDTLKSLYGNFVANVLGLRLFSLPSERNPNEKEYFTESLKDRETCYSIISLNYDLVFENFLRAILDLYISQSELKFEKQVYFHDWEMPHLAKLHGCVDLGIIIPPTWAKGINKKVSVSWENAFNILSNSNQIRILGYSLPLSDAYIKYLLKAAVINAPHLKNIDVILLDPSGQAKIRYDNFIQFNYYRFANADILDYLKLLQEKQNKGKNINGGYQHASVKMNLLEETHSDFMK